MSESRFAYYLITQLPYYLITFKLPNHQTHSTSVGMLHGRLNSIIFEINTRPNDVVSATTFNWVSAVTNHHR